MSLWTWTGGSAASRPTATFLRCPSNEVPATFAARVGPVFAEEALQAAGGAAWAHPALIARR